ncbi:DinB family protein [Mucilaginibacter myungsuensis]|uniref:DinB family protein n=1 Tax=Mucilaginibacter myungsuensis TaxID=649104 RepID=A0A929PWP1_9SPHI|nr:DinB family protein [Mucilaginibacter myungsuensis]MBE9661387.1 DinB family protein [Mucilaginibacter myungsuensis]MDN3597530.1 DinB family protein [Mucilaginibacter myungsuensis]
MISKPSPNEYSPFAAGYVALAADHDDVLKLLADLMQSTADLFYGLPPKKADYKYAPDKWTIKEVICHLIDTERIFTYRALCIARGEKQNLPGFEQDDYMAHVNANDRAVEDLIAEFSTVRSSSLYLLRSLTTIQAENIGSSNGHPTSARALAYMIAGHELHHLNILKERYL